MNLFNKGVTVNARTGEKSILESGGNKKKQHKKQQSDIAIEHLRKYTKYMLT